MSSAVACSSALVRDDAEMMRCVIRLRVGRDSYIDKHNALYCWWTRPQRAPQPASRISHSPGSMHIGCFSSSKSGVTGRPLLARVGPRSRRPPPPPGAAGPRAPRTYRPQTTGTGSLVDRHLMLCRFYVFLTISTYQKAKGISDVNDHAPGRRPGDTHLTGAATLARSALVSSAPVSSAVRTRIPLAPLLPRAPGTRAHFFARVDLARLAGGASSSFSSSW